MGGEIGCGGVVGRGGPQENWRCGTEGRGPEKGPAGVSPEWGGAPDRLSRGAGGVGRAGRPAWG